MQAIQGLRLTYRLEDLLKFTGVARSTFYYNLKKSKQPEPYLIEKERIKQIYDQHKGRYGYRRITLQLRNEGYLLNQKTVYKLMGELKLKAKIRIKKYRSYKGEIGRIAPNIINREFYCDRPYEKLVTDVTEVKINGVKGYLSPIMDMYNGEIIDYTFSRIPDLEMVLSMVKKVFSRIKIGQFTILHSDQGCHYQNPRYRALLNKYGIIQSMSRKGNCLDNAMMENFFGIMKAELLYLQEFADMEHFKKELDRYIYYYNNSRIKLRLNGLSPVLFRTLNYKT
jgi:putative transposase